MRAIEARASRERSEASLSPCGRGLGRGDPLAGQHAATELVAVYANMARNVNVEGGSARPESHCRGEGLYFGLSPASVIRCMTRR